MALQHCTGSSAPPADLLSASLQESVDLGEIMFSLCYLPTAGRLTLTVIKCRNLKAMDITGYSGTSPIQVACTGLPAARTLGSGKRRGRSVSVLGTGAAALGETPLDSSSCSAASGPGMLWFPSLRSNFHGCFRDTRVHSHKCFSCVRHIISTQQILAIIIILSLRRG